jgi:xanthine dehydrogenase accessory factor
MMNKELLQQAAQLETERLPFVLATVVRALRPTSVRPGDAALVLADGTIVGFVGGVCAESSVRLYSLRALETGEPLLLRLVPGAGDTDMRESVDGAVVEHNPCLSGGALEIFLEPQLPAPRVIVVGSAPIAKAVAELAAAAGYAVARGAGEALHPDSSDTAVIVASHGSDEQRVLAEALTAGVPYVALIASPARGAAVREALKIPDELRPQLHTPAGLNIGARSPAEIAISVLAQLVAELHADPERGSAGSRSHPQTSLAAAVDPECGMTVAVTDSTLHLDLREERLFFCSEHCRDAYAAGQVEHGATGHVEHGATG